MIIEFYSTLRLELGIKRTTLEIKDGITVEELLHRLSKETDYNVYEKLVKDGKPITGTNILINGKNFHHLEKLQTKLRNSDLVQIFPPAAGG